MTRRHIATTTVPPVTTEPTPTSGAPASLTAHPAPTAALLASTAFGSGSCGIDDATSTRRLDDATHDRGDAA
jgi:hypothetical protein